MDESDLAGHKFRNEAGDGRSLGEFVSNEKSIYDDYRAELEAAEKLSNLEQIVRDE